MSEVLYVSFEEKDKRGDKAALCVMRKNSKSFTLLRTILGEEAETLYKILTGQSDDGTRGKPSV